jgi:hypothetical protein
MLPGGGSLFFLPGQEHLLSKLVETTGTAFHPRIPSGWRQSSCMRSRDVREERSIDDRRQKARRFAIEIH